MNKTVAGFVGFIGGLVIAYIAIIVGWATYTDLFEVSDLGGGKAMGIAFFVAPIGAVIAGIVCAILLIRRAGRRSGETTPV